MSSDSGRSGKRGRGSVDSNSSKKQKTLGVAWGANSSSASKAVAFRASPFPDFGSYMEEKNRKLRSQFDVDAATSSPSGSNEKKGLFHGISIFVDGYTVPSSLELRSYMLKHGGRFENYFSRKRVTHIICSNLPDSKIKNLRSFSRGLPVVKPAWLLDSIAANRVLAWVPYQLEQLLDGALKQHNISSFFTLRSKSMSDCSLSHFRNQHSDDDSSAATYTNKRVEYVHNASLCQDDDRSHAEIVHSDDGSSMVGTNTSERELSVDDPSLPQEDKKCSPVTGQYTIADHAGSSSCRNAEISSTELAELVDPAIPTEDQQLTDARPYGVQNSSLGDPNFVENYFKSSRLHFIGTWRNRYRKRFCRSLHGAPDNKFGASTSPTSKSRSIIHVDMDCFFVAVVIRNLPELHDKPVAVCHSDSSKGTAEISSANYPARDHGIRAGMFVRDAKALCPHLVVMPYNFEAYEEVDDQFYSILHKHCNKIQAISCDEAFLDVTDLEGKDPESLTSIIRREIVETTGCSASAGIATNLLMARLATKKAQPHGQFHIPEEQEVLRREFGIKTCEMLWRFSRGIDNRQVQMTQEIKSVGAEVNWGVGFSTPSDVSLL